MRERTGRMKARKLVGGDTDSLIGGGGEKKAVQRKSLTSSHRETSAQPVSEQWPPWKPNLLFFLLHPCFYCWAWRSMVRTILLTNLGQLPWLPPLPSSCPSPAYWQRGHGEKQRRSWRCGCSAEQQPKYWCVVSFVLVTSPRHSSV